jgi:hypothetical protein
MNAADVLRYGQATVMRELDKLPVTEWDSTAAAGTWSVKDVVAHLASFQWVLADVLQGLQGGTDTPTLDRLLASEGHFDLTEVTRRRGWTAEMALADYQRACAETERLLAEVSPERLRQPGTIPWYGPEYSVDDLIVYMVYGHAREHAVHFAQAAERRAV